MRTTIPNLRRMIRKVINESMSDTVRDLQDVMDTPRGPVGNRSMSNYLKREREAEEYKRNQYYEKLAAEEATAEKNFVRLQLPHPVSPDYLEWKSWLESLYLSGAEFIRRDYWDNHRKQKPQYFHFKIDKQKALEIETEGNQLPTHYANGASQDTLVSATVRRADGIS